MQNRPKDKCLVLCIFTIGIIRHISMDILQKVYEINFPVGLIFNTSIVCFIPILCYLYVKKTISNDNTINSTDTIHFVVFIIFYIPWSFPFSLIFLTGSLMFLLFMNYPVF